MQTFFLTVTPFMFYSLVWLVVILSIVAVLLFVENRRLLRLSEISHWGCTQLIEAARRAYQLTAYTAAKRWEIFIKDVDDIQIKIRNEKKDKKSAG